MTKEKAIAVTKSGLCKFGGFVFFSLGFAGIFLPLLPTTIFWIMAVWLYSRSHPEMIDKIYNWPHVGQIVKDYIEGGVINDRSKKIATVGIVVFGGLSILLANLSSYWNLGFMALFSAIIIYIWSCQSE